MSDSHKISLLDLQAPDMSQYGKKNIGLDRGATRNVDSSYRRQLSESLSKKQTNSSTDKVPQAESRSAGLNADQSRAGSKTSESRSTTEPRDNRVTPENQQRGVSRNDSASASETSRVTNSGPEKTTAEQEQTTAKLSETIEATEETINAQSEITLPVKEKEQSYSLFNTSAIQNDGVLEQETTAVDSEILPPANFQLVDEQQLVNLQTEVTETGANEVVPIPEGLADLLNQQVIETSQTDSGQEVQTIDAVSLDQELKVVEQVDETLTGQATGEETAAELDSLLDSEEFSELKNTEELKQALEGVQENQSDNATGTADENELNTQAIIQQRYQRSRNEEQSDSSNEEANAGENALDQESVQQISETVIDQLQQKPESEQPDIKEIVKESSARETEPTKQTEQQTEVAPQSLVNQGLPSAAETLSQVQSETTKATSVTQDPVASIDNDQALAQPTGVNQSSRTTGAQPTAPVGTSVDAKQIDQLVERVAEGVRQSQSTGQQLKIRLSPPELGTLQIEVSLKNGEYTAKMEVQSSRTQKMINDNIAQLKEALIKTGVSLDRIDVHINTDSTEDQRSSHSDAQTQSGSDFDSNEFSENTGDSEQRQQEPGFTEESARQEDSTAQEQPQISRSQGIATENVEEIDVQI